MCVKEIAAHNAGRTLISIGEKREVQLLTHVYFLQSSFNILFVDQSVTEKPEREMKGEKGSSLQK
jgi:hypothetical protein